MNEQIQQLAKLAKERVPAGLFVERWIEFYNEEFAKLIIQECISAVEDTNDRYRKDYFASKIKQHFGLDHE